MDIAILPTTALNAAAAPFLPRFPFDDVDADVILRSCDSVDFRVHKLLLSLSSSVFRDMFTLPQSEDSLPIIPVSEDKYALENLLMWCDPRGEPAIGTLEELQVVLEAADKYGMDRIIVRVGNVLKMSPFIAQEPVRVFAIAWRYRLEDTIRLAAKYTLPLTLGERPNLKELKFIPATALQHLYDYYVACGKAASQASQMVKCNLACGRNVPCWLSVWRNHIKTALLDRPCRATVLEATIEQRPETKGCPLCNHPRAADMKLFGQSIVAEVETTISAVTLVIEF